MKSLMIGFAAISLSLSAFASDVKPGMYLSMNGNCFFDIQATSDQKLIVSEHQNANSTKTGCFQIYTVFAKVSAENSADTYYTANRDDQTHGNGYASAAAQKSFRKLGMKSLDDGSIVFARKAEKLNDQDNYIRAFPVANPTPSVESKDGLYRRKIANLNCLYTIKKDGENVIFSATQKTRTCNTPSRIYEPTEIKNVYVTKIPLPHSHGHTYNSFLRGAKENLYVMGRDEITVRYADVSKPLNDDVAVFEIDTSLVQP